MRTESPLLLRGITSQGDSHFTLEKKKMLKGFSKDTQMAIRTGKMFNIIRH